MTTAADDRATEDAFEALLAGRPAPGGAAGLAAFTGAVRGAAAAPGRPSAELADLLSTGLLTAQSSPSTGTAPTAGTARSPGRTRRRATVIVPALIAKFLSAGAVAQAAAGAGVVVVVTAGAGTVGVLPEDAQTVFSDVTGFDEVTDEPTAPLVTPTEDVEEPVDGEDPLDAADPTPTAPVEPAEVVEEDEPAEPAEEDAEQPAADTELTRDEWKDEGPDAFASFGQWVSYGATRGWNYGGVVADWAHEKKRDAGGTGTPEAPEDGSGDDEPEPEVGSSDDRSGGGGTGNDGRGDGSKGDGGKGDGGKGDGGKGKGKGKD